MSFEVGQKVIRAYRMRGRRPAAGHVVKVSRKFCVAEFPLSYGVGTTQVLFDKETGHERTLDGKPSVSRLIGTDEWGAADRASALKAALSEKGVEITTDLTNEQLEAIAAIVGVEA